MDTASTGFTLEQIRIAHAKVKSGADFPAYIREMKQLGVLQYETFVADGHTDFFGDNHYSISSPAKYDTLEIAAQSNEEMFKADLLAHQQGKTDYRLFCADCAKSGIDKWRVDINNMTCTYYDKNGTMILVEDIPQ